MRLFICLCLLTACQKKPDALPVILSAPKFHLANHWQTDTIANPSIRGLSGADQDNSGVIWLVPERQPILLSWRLSNNGLEAQNPAIPLQGVPKGMDTESLAWLEPGLLALGTETQEKRDQDKILFVRINNQQARVETSISLPYSLWDITARKNHGIEGLCSVPNLIIAAAELEIKVQDKRWAPSAVWNMINKTWTPFRLALTSDNGLLSSLDCRRDSSNGSIELVGIERWYGVVRLVHWTIPDPGTGKDIEATWWEDVATLLPKPLNLEGLVWEQNQRFIMFNDNDSGGSLSGSNEVVVLEQTVK